MKLHISKTNFLQFALLLILSPSILPAEEAVADVLVDKQRWTFSFYYENDLFANTDRNYTSGTKFSWISGDLSEYRDAQRVPDWVHQAMQHLPFIHEDGIQRNVVFSIGQNIYTPDRIEETALITDDRPYAGWLYLAVAYHNKTPNWLDTIELNLGVVGPWALAKESQNFVHRVRNIQTAKGWHNQIRNEPVINLVWERKYRYQLLGDKRGFAADTFVHVGASLGNLFTYANTGTALRFGWNLPDDFGASVIRPAGDTNAPASTQDIRMNGKPGFSIHFFAAVDGRFVARDLTLEGNTWRDSHSVPKENWVGDLSLGIATVINHWKISYAQTFRSATYKNSDKQVFGSINISYTY